MTETSDLHVKKDEDVWVVTINRPRRRNALDDPTIESLLITLAEAEQDRSVAGLVITGADDVAFCSGSDIKAVAEMTRAQAVNHTAHGQALMNAIEASPCLTVAGVNGYALGGGFELALACDLIVAGDSAQFGLPELRNGMVPAWGGTFRLTRAVGLARARNIVLGGETLDARAALAAGLAIEVIKPDETLTRARQRVTELASYAGRDEISLIKSMLKSGVGATSEQGTMVELLAETTLSYAERYGTRR